MFLIKESGGPCIEPVEFLTFYIKMLGSPILSLQSAGEYVIIQYEMEYSGPKDAVLRLRKAALSRERKERRNAMKKFVAAPEMDVVKFQAEDILEVSESGTLGEDDLPIA